MRGYRTFAFVCLTNMLFDYTRPWEKVMTKQFMNGRAPFFHHFCLKHSGNYYTHHFYIGHRPLSSYKLHENLNVINYDQQSTPHVPTSLEVRTADINEGDFWQMTGWMNSCGFMKAMNMKMLLLMICLTSLMPTFQMLRMKTGETCIGESD